MSHSDFSPITNANLHIPVDRVTLTSHRLGAIHRSGKLADPDFTQTGRDIDRSVAKG